MAIEMRQPGAAKAAIRAGSIVGKAKRAEEDRARAEREQVRADIVAAQRKSLQAKMAFDLQKAEILNQRAFERELRGEDYRLMAEDRAADRAIERIEFSKDMDFQYKTQERIRKIGVIDASDAGIDKEVESGRFKESDPSIIMARFENWRIRREIETGVKPPQKPKPRSAVSQVSEIDATLELESYTRQDLIEAGLDPADFPSIAANEDAVEVAIRGQIAQIEEQGGQVYFNKRTGERVVSYDGGETWEPLGDTRKEEEIPVEITDDKEGFLRRLLLSKPLEGRIPKSIPADFGVFDRNR